MARAMCRAGMTEGVMIELRKIAGFEIAKMASSQDIAFRIRSRRNRLLGLWAASHLGLSDGAGDAYARDLVAAGVHRSGDDHLVQRIRQDFAAQGVRLDMAAIRREMERLSGLAALEHGMADHRPRPVAA